ncbi:hypothetical protein M8C13_32375 [Crossiella sp. SN42]|uniref:hypothetical protein n=1 Tax=Crossiella sp. SN42 TaxID=2944808 RepID=UPI00207D57C8|nr:hypothetical protein [Crossiella sp. SN42]MCO1580460.1 hypothetical protein [Crossiella sp. SN42]
MARRIRSVLVGVAVAVVAGCGAMPCGSRPPTPPMAQARALSDGVAGLNSVEAQLVAAAANEPRRPGAQPDGSNYFTALATLARHGRERAGQLSRTAADGGVESAELLGKLNELAGHYAALEGACQQRDVAATRRARQAVTTTMVALNTLTPHLSGG